MHFDFTSKIIAGQLSSAFSCFYAIEKEECSMITEWSVVTVMIALIGLFSTVYGPLSKNTKENTKAMTELSINIRNLTEQVKAQEEDNEKAIKRLWSHNDEQDARILNVEQKLMLMSAKESAK